MLRIAMYTTIKTLKEQGLNKSQIAKATGHDWKTVNKVLQAIAAGKEVPIQKAHPRLLDGHQEKILAWVEIGLSALRIHDNLTREGVKIGYSSVKDFVARVKRKQDIFIRVHTEPAEEAQVDFGYVGYTNDNAGKRRKTWVFNMRLSYSRLDYYCKVYDQKVETFILCHIQAFRYFGGIPKTVKIDNLKAAILEAHFYEPIFQQLYKQFSEHYGFQPIPCRIYQPNDKGKVESGIKYVKGNFFVGRSFQNGDEVDKQLLAWLEIANSRVHGTTKKIPQIIFEEKEKSLLNPLPLQEFSLAKVGTRKVYHDCHIYVGGNYYSVPYAHVGQIVEIEINAGILRIYANHVLIATHTELSSSGEFSTQTSHYPDYKCLSQTEYQEKYQAKMAAIGHFAEQVFLGMLTHHKNAWSRPVQGVLSLTKSFPAEIVNLACQRALAYCAYEYQVIKNICQNGSYALPVELNSGETNE